MAIVLAGQLRQVADPNRPEDRAFESPADAVGRILQPLGESAHVLVVGGPTDPNGDVYWQVADAAFPGCCAPFGWVREAESGGQAAIAPYKPDCPDPSTAVTGNDLFELGMLEAVSCYGTRDFALSGSVTCDQPVVDSYLTIAGPDWTHARTLCKLDDAVAIYGEAVTTFAPAQGRFDGTAALTAHFNDPSSDQCRWAPGTFMPIAVDDAPVDTAQFACRTSLYVTQATPEI